MTVRLFILYGDLEGVGPVHRNGVWAQVNAAKECLPVTYLGAPWSGATPPNGCGRLLDAIGRWQPGWAKEICERGRADAEPNGANILLHMVNSGHHMRWADRLAPIWSIFTHRVLYVVDTLQPAYVSPRDLSRYDLVASWCADLAQEFEKVGLPTIFLPPHTDVLNFHSVWDYRPIDTILVGRRDAGRFEPIHRHLNADGRRRISLDFVTRTQGEGSSAENEFRALSATHTRASAAFCFEASAVSRFMGRSPLMERWIHAWTFGCTVFGTRPKGRGVAERMDWPESVIGLPPDPREAVEVIEAALSDHEGMRRRRIRNVQEALRRHDTRHRLSDLLSYLGIEQPPTLHSGLQRLSEAHARLENTGPQSPARLEALEAPADLRKFPDRLGNQLAGDSQ